MQQQQQQFGYNDYANVQPPPESLPSAEGRVTSSALVQFTDPKFPARLHYVLSELEKDGMSHIASWQPHGRCFKVHRPDEFVEQVLCRWFRQSQYASFQRQLSVYGFRRIVHGPDKGSYYHELFLRGKAFLSHRIVRGEKRTCRSNRPFYAEVTAPNFYAMSSMPPSIPMTDVVSGEGDTSLAQSALQAEHCPPSVVKTYVHGAHQSSGDRSVMDQTIFPAQTSPALNAMTQVSQPAVKNQLIIPVANRFTSQVTQPQLYLSGHATGGFLPNAVAFSALPWFALQSGSNFLAHANTTEMTPNSGVPHMSSTLMASPTASPPLASVANCNIWQTVLQPGLQEQRQQSNISRQLMLAALLNSFTSPHY